jgi:hypothetical protein
MDTVSIKQSDTAGIEPVEQNPAFCYIQHFSAEPDHIKTFRKAMLFFVLQELSDARHKCPVAASDNGKLRKDTAF